MNRLIAVCLTALLLPPLSPALAHEGDPAAPGISEHTTDEGNVVEGTAIVDGTVRELKGLLYDVERWPSVFSDVRSVEPRSDAPWALDFKRFGHAHDFEVLRTPRGVVLELAMQDHGTARMEYLLQPYDRARSTLTVRFTMATPPQLTTAAFVAMLRGKLASDLEDFRRAAARTGPTPGPTSARP